MQKQKIILIAGIALGLIAVFMVNVYITQQRQMAVEEAKRKVESIKADLQTNQTPVLMAKEDIPAGSQINPEKLEVKIVPNQFVQPQAVTSLDRIAGMLTIAPISKGEQVTLSKLSFKQAAGGGLAGVTPVGKRAITISVDNISSLAGMIKPGDYVDVIAAVPVPVPVQGSQQVATQAAVIPLFQNVLILAVGQEINAVAPPPQDQGRYASSQPQRENSSVITLALTPQEANLIAFVQEQGKIRLILRSPADSQVQPQQPASWETLFQYIMPQNAAKSGEVQETKVEEKPYVEIYRGLNKEKVPLQ